jgi:ATP-binding cassette subfamily B (MDR/TAP) protein 1
LFAVASVLPHFADLADAANTVSALRRQIEWRPRVNVRDTSGVILTPTESGQNQDAARKAIQLPKFELRNVTFAYPSRPASKTLDRLSIQFEAGKTTALVGTSGSGKSTILALLSREYDPETRSAIDSEGDPIATKPPAVEPTRRPLASLPDRRPQLRHMFSSQSSCDDLEKGVVDPDPADDGLVQGAGEVFFEGIDIRRYNLQSYRQRIAIVSQDPQLFSLSIFGNVAAGLSGTNLEYNSSHNREDDSDPQVRLAAVSTARLVREALEKAEAWDFVAALPDGMYTVVSGEGNHSLSGGQRQRIALARALIRRPTVLLLDEATSALDLVTEEKIRRTLEKEQRARSMTLIIVAHRIRTIVSAHRIVVMQAGRIVDDGICQELMRDDRVDRTFREMMSRGKSPAGIDSESPKSEAAEDIVCGSDDQPSQHVPISPSGSSSEGSDMNLLSSEKRSDQEVRSIRHHLSYQTASSTSAHADVSQHKEQRFGPRSATEAQVTITREPRGLQRTGKTRLVRECWNVLGGKRLCFAFGLVCAIAAGAGWPIESWLVGEAVHALSSSTVDPDATTTRNNRWSLWFLVLAIVLFSFLLANGVAFELASEKMIHNLRTAGMRALLQQEIGFFETDRDANPGALTSTLLSRSADVTAATGIVLSQIVMACVNLVGALLLGATLSWKITLASRCVTT